MLRIRFFKGVPTCMFVICRSLKKKKNTPRLVVFCSLKSELINTPILASKDNIIIPLYVKTLNFT